MTNGNVIMHENARFGLFLQADCGGITGIFEACVGFLESAKMMECLWSAKVVLILLIDHNGGCKQQ